MKIGTLLTAAIVSLSAVGGGLAAYVAVTKYQTMDKVSTAQSRLEIVRAVGDIPRYMNSERGMSTNLLFSTGAIDQKQIGDLDRLRELTDGALAKVNQVRAALPGALDDGEAVASAIDALKAKFAALRDAIEKAIAGPLDARKPAAAKIVADNSVFNAGVTTLLDEQVRRLAGLDGNAYRQASYANVAWTLRDIGGLDASLHKALVGAKRVATEPEKMELYRSTGRTQQILSTLQELRNNPATPANVMTALGKMQADYVERFGKALKFAKEGATSGKYEQDVETYYAESQFGLASIVTVRDAFYENAEQGLAAAYSSARFSFVVALVGLLAVIAGSAGLIVMVRRRILNPIAALTGRMSRLAAGEVAEAIPGAARNDEIGAMAAAVQVFKDNKIEADRLATEKEAENDVKMRRARALDDLTRAFEAKVTELVGGLSAASSVMEDTAQSMSATASATNRQAAVVAAASDQTSTNVQTVASATEELTSSISEIARQVATSTEIAARAIDHARRTGDAARGLAVVASEVKSLAGQTAKATTEISEQITAIQTASDETVTAIRNVVDVITEIDQIGTAIAAAIEEQGSATKEISRSVQEAARGTQEVNSNISGVQRAADDTGAAATQVLGAAEQLSTQSKDLAGQVNRFLSDVRAA